MDKNTLHPKPDYASAGQYVGTKEKLMHHISNKEKVSTEKTMLT